MAIRTGPEAKVELSGFGRPLVYYQAAGIRPTERDGAASVLKPELNRLFDLYPVTVARHLELGPTLGPLGRYLLARGATAQTTFSQVIDLSRPLEMLREEFRGSYKSLLNWGEKNLTLRIITANNVAPADIEAFRRLHIAAAGRETRSERSWELQGDMIRQREAFAVFAALDGELVSAALFCHSAKYCYYGVSASKRELFDKPLGHSVLWKAIIHAKELACHWFEIGEQLFPNHGETKPTPKELGIAAFKKGFGGETILRTTITWTA